MEFQEMIVKYWYVLDATLIVTIFCLIQLLKAPIKKKYPNFVVFLPFILSGLTVFFLSNEIQAGKDYLSNFKAWGGQTLIYTAGTFILYNMFYEPFIRPIVQKTKEKEL